MDDKKSKALDDARLFLESLKVDGIEEIFLESTQPQADSSSGTSTAAALGAVELKKAMVELRDEAYACTLCSELSSTRKKVVFGSGNIRADLMFVGEAPGRDEDEQGMPFVGRSGQLLTKIIESIGIKREQAFIVNTLKCRPPENRPPKADEIMNCNSYLLRQIDLIQPKIIVALGKFAAQTLLETETPISQLRGHFSEFYGIPLMCTYHPAYLLRSPGEKVKVWDDMKKVRDELVRLKTS